MMQDKPPEQVKPPKITDRPLAQIERMLCNALNIEKSEHPQDVLQSIALAEHIKTQAELYIKDKTDKRDAIIAALGGTIVK